MKIIRKGRSIYIGSEQILIEHIKDVLLIDDYHVAILIFGFHENGTKLIRNEKINLIDIEPAFSTANDLKNYIIGLLAVETTQIVDSEGNDVNYKISQIDEVSDSITYIGYSEPNTIKKIITIGKITSFYTAVSEGTYAEDWDDRENLTYNLD